MSTTTNNNNNNNNQTTEDVVIVKADSVQDIQHIIISSKLTVPVAHAILNSPLKDEFIASFTLLLTTMDLHPTTKVAFLAGCFGNRMYDLGRSLLDTNKFTFVEILKCLKVLDSKRVLRVYKKKLATMLEKARIRQERIDKITEEYMKTKQDSNNNNNGNDTKKEKKVEEKKEDVAAVETTKKPARPTKKVAAKSKGKGKGKGKGKKAITPKEDEKKELTEDEKKKVEKRQSKQEREAMFKNRFENTKKFFESKIAEYEAYQCNGSLCGSVTKVFKNWFKTVPVKTLEFFALGQPKETWKEIADLLHLAPSDFQLPWFLEFMFGKPAPEGTSVHAFDQAKAASDEGKSVDYGAIIEKYRPPYSFLRKRLTETEFTQALKLKVAEYEEVSNVLWWYHEFQHVAGADKLIVERMAKGEKLTLAYGTLIEKTMSLTKKEDHKEVFEALLKATLDRLATFANKFSLPPPIATLGDRSGSMEVAVRLATIIGYLITNLTPNSTLSFFNTANMEAPVKPSSIDQLFKLTDLVKATGGTANAVGLQPFLKEKKPLKYLVMVTDEEENQKVDNMYFAEMFDKYRKEVTADCKLVFISFLRANQKGQMVTQLKNTYDIEPIQFVLDRSTPDVTKIDMMLTSLSCESPMFLVQQDLLTKVFSLFGAKFFFKYLEESKNKLFTYGFNSEIEVFVLQHLCNFYLKSLDKEDVLLTNFKGLVGDESNCLRMVNEHLKTLVTVSKECGLEELVTQVDIITKKFNSLQRQHSVEYLRDTLNSLDKELFNKRVEA
ncbi:hypothetical protein SAMD00019534_078230 [Acytostelium subglobosum LB1]|uniref:hypothetical protein n=1 Tax=Acytostelium subglobosum LB1 TaxID=1410327 RepID=UPI0006451D77|nr:hypothetical protein SAMD00019534_078230 [Acytostelium subglobosum LB1]GAM24648.1 hypothetical protein SAMD00019534_078230 [Acytostelium subglobosum LB1]|eukprot:XP_012752317.1 hypothetical protein SAMD00019534_078230 [Acytostelium subglobosum LB1]